MYCWDVLRRLYDIFIKNMKYKKCIYKKYIHTFLIIYLVNIFH